MVIKQKPLGFLSKKMCNPIQKRKIMYSWELKKTPCVSVTSVYILRK